MKTLPTNNEAWGFHGTVLTNEQAANDKEAADLFHKASVVLIGLGFTKAQAQCALDGRPGRHLADWLDNLDQLEEKTTLAAKMGWFQFAKDEVK